MAAHGTRTSYVGGCRCEPCKEANRTYARERERHRRRVEYGIEAPKPSKWTSPVEAKEHLLWLRSQGIGTRTVSNVTGLARSAILEILKDEHAKILKTTASKILAVSKVHLPAGSDFVDARPTWNLIDDLVYLGFPKARIARELGFKTRAIQLNRKLISRSNAEAVERAYQRLIRKTAYWHGLISGYKKNGCRCLRCRTTHSEYQNDLRERKAATT